MKRYTGATPPMPDHFKKRMQDTLGGLETMHTIYKRRKLTTALVAALVAMLALTGIAYAAAQSGILSKIFTRSEPNESAEQSVVHVNASAESELMSLRINDYVLSGSDLYVDWTLDLKTGERLAMISSGLTTELPRDVFADSDVPHSLGSILPWTDLMPESWSSMNEGYFYNGAPEEPVEVSMRLALVRPDPDALQIEAFTVADCPNTPVWVYDDSSVSRQYGYYYDGENFADDQDETYWADFDSLSQGEFLKKYGFGEVVDALEVSFIVQAGNVQLRTLAAPERFTFDGYALEVRKVEFNGFNAEIECAIQTDDPDFMESGTWFFACADGEPLEFASQMDTGDGEILLTFWSEGGCALLPDEITLAPGEYVWNDGFREQRIDMEQAVTLSLQ